MADDKAGRPQVYDPKLDTGNHDVALGVVKQGSVPMVQMLFDRPITHVLWEAENARIFAEQLARCAYEAHYGVKPAAAGSKLSEEKRLHLTHRIALVANSEAKRGRNNLQIATAVLDAILKEVV